MRWEDERYVRVYTRDTAEWLALGWEAQALLVLLLRKADRAGIVQTGKAGARGIVALVGMPPDVGQRALTALLEDGCLREMAGGYVFPNFLAAQEARSTDAHRKREQRARDREKALAGGSVGSLSGLDVEARMSRVSGQQSVTASHHDVTPYGHTASQNVTDVTSAVTGDTRGVTGDVTNVTPYLAVPSRTVPFTASQSAAAADARHDDLPDATEAAHEVCDARPPLILEAQVATAPTRTPSAGEALYSTIEFIRKEECERHGLPFIPSRWAYSRQNKDLGPVAKLPKGHEDKVRFEAAWLAFLADPKALELDEPLSLAFFWKMRSRYEGLGLRGEP